MTQTRDAQTRRAFLAGGAAAAAWITVPGGPMRASAAQAGGAASGSPASAAGRRRALRFAHMTDIHVQPELRAAEGMAAALHDAQSLEDPVELVVTGGDLVMDCFEAGEARTQEQWTLFDRVLRENCRVPVQHCLGNHDFWGGNAQKSRTRGDEPRWGKAWAREVLGLAADHHSFERAGWKFVVLDSVRRMDDGYTGLIEPAQLEWLRGELAATARSTPIVVVSHIPLLTVTIIANDPNRAKDLSITLPGDLMHSDSAKLCRLFAEHPNVKLCLSGHIHQLDRIEWRGVTFICDGAVSGAWWKGPNGSTPEGYGVVDLYDDGSFDWAYRAYGWDAKRA